MNDVIPKMTPTSPPARKAGEQRKTSERWEKNMKRARKLTVAEQLSTALIALKDEVRPFLMHDDEEVQAWNDYFERFQRKRNKAEMPPAS